MADKEYQIAEIAIKGCHWYYSTLTVEDCMKCPFRNGGCDSRKLAEKLIEEGYHKDIDDK